MKSRDEVFAAIKAGRKSQCIDRRDFERLVDFFPVSDWDAFGFSLKDVATAPEP